jgi:pyrimidine operon attenuation protein/uracil phosphoribosyltransferase
MVSQVVLDAQQMRRALMRIAHEIVERNDDLGSLYLVGVPNGGVPLARQLAGNLAEIADLEPVVGVLDTTLYRDDLVSSGARPKLRRTEMPSAVDDQVVILVDDVCSTGRTIRAAMDALMDFGRPRAVQVVALVDRGHRELPIKIDFVGKNIPTKRTDLVKMRTADGAHGDPVEVVLLQPVLGGAAS